jgi:Tfp pilus assembly protein PilX
MKKTTQLYAQQGVSLVGAIFILVILAAIGVAMVTLSSTTTSTSALNVEQKRAYYAAKSGMEWAIKQVLLNDEAASDGDPATINNDSCTGLDKTLADNFSINNFALIVGCSATCCNLADTDCTSSYCCDDDATPGDCSLNPRVTKLNVTASKGSSGDIYQVSRTIQTTISHDSP